MCSFHAFGYNWVLLHRNPILDLHIRIYIVDNGIVRLYYILQEVYILKLLMY